MTVAVYWKRLCSKEKNRSHSTGKQLSVIQHAKRNLWDESSYWYHGYQWTVFSVVFFKRCRKLSRIPALILPLNENLKNNTKSYFWQPCIICFFMLSWPSFKALPRGWSVSLLQKLTKTTFQPLPLSESHTLDHIAPTLIWARYQLSRDNP